MTTRLREPGEFCWINVLAADIPVAKTFFTGLLDWDWAPMPPYGDMIRVDGHNMGGLFPSTGPGAPPGTKPVIGVMVRITDADAMAEKVRLLGGKAEPPMDIGPNGRMVVCHDPSGANFDLWQPKIENSADMQGNENGAFSWFEVLSNDVPRDIRFYEQLFDWTSNTMQMGTLGTYTTFGRGTDFIAGMVPMASAPPGSTPVWSTYFTVTDLDATMKRIAPLGGTLLFGPHEVPGVGRMCGVQAIGLTFFLMQYVR